MNQRTPKKKAGRAGMIAAAVLLALGGMAGCNFGIPDYTLTVVVEDGVTGTPLSGKYTYKDTEPNTISFSYTAVNTLHTVEVLLNGGVKRINGSGSIVLFRDGYELRARLVDIRGTWTCSMVYTDTTSANVEATLTLTGDDLLSGVFTDSRGYSGKWSAENNTLILLYSNWLDYIFIGTVFDMSGNFAGDGQSGTFTTTRKQ